MKLLIRALKVVLAALRARGSACAWVCYARARLHTGRITHRKQQSPFPAEAIIFSKDRALQLHGLLRSFFDNVTPRVPVQVLYACSTPEHEKAYDSLKALFNNCGITFAQQQAPDSFRRDLLALVNAVHAEKMFFLVDDIVFINPVDLGFFCSFAPYRYVPTLKMGLNLKRCYTMQQDQPLPPFADAPAGADAICWKWRDGVHDWGYPLSVDGHFFSTGEIKAMLALIDFSAPNSLEQNMQRFMPLFLPRLGIACRRSTTVNIPCNKVQLENNNICGNQHQEDLLAYWQQGMQMDIKPLQGFVSESVHQDIGLKLIPR